MQHTSLEASVLKASVLNLSVLNVSVLRASTLKAIYEGCFFYKGHDSENHCTPWTLSCLW